MTIDVVGREHGNDSQGQMSDAEYDEEDDDEDEAEEDNEEEKPSGKHTKYTDLEERA